MSQSKRQYVPNIGDHVKLQRFDDYSLYGIKTVWAWLEVKALRQLDDTRTQVDVEVLNGDQPTGEHRQIYLSSIAPPLGWEPVYSIVCSSFEQAQKVLEEWFSRGIHVWKSKDLSSGGRAAFTPADVEGAPHWQYGKAPVETIQPADCPRLFTIECLEEWEPNLPPTPWRGDQPEERRRKKAIRRTAIAELRKSGADLEFIPDGYGGKMAICSKVTVIYKPAE